MHSLGTIEGKLDGMNQRLDNFHDRVEIHDTKISDMEKWQANLKGMIAVITAVGSAIGGTIIVLITKYFSNR